MQKRVFSLLFLAVMFLGTSWTASADTINLAPDDPIQSGFGPYRAIANGTDSILIICVDQAHALDGPWEATITPLNGDLSGTRFFASGGDYIRAAFLVDEMFNRPDEPNDDIQRAIWRLVNGEGFGEENEWYFCAVEANMSNFDLSRFVILTPTNPDLNQEMIQPIPVPEPATMLLLGTGLAGVSAAVRKRRSKSI